jgi:hypothetical protein
MQKEGDSSDFGEIAPTTRHYPALQIKTIELNRFAVVMGRMTGR